MRNLPLHEVHAAAGARFSARAGVEVVEAFDSAEAEWRALEEAVGVADRSERALLTVIGKEARLYLHGMTTNEVKALQPGQGNRATIINARGKMVGDAQVLCFSEEALVVALPPECHEATAAHLDQYLVSEDCELGDATGGSVIVGLYGKKAGDALTRALGHPPPSLPENHHVVDELAGVAVRLVSAAPEGVAGWEVWVSAEQGQVVWEALVEAARAEGGAPVGQATLEAARIHAAVPRYGADLDESTIPLEANLDAAINYAKGCYVGQEVIAKATFRGQLRRRLVRFVLPGGVEPGRALLEPEGRSLGTITSVIDPDPAGGPPLGLGYLRRDRMEVGARIPLEGGGEAIVDWFPPERER